MLRRVTLHRFLFNQRRERLAHAIELVVVNQPLFLAAVSEHALCRSISMFRQFVGQFENFVVFVHRLCIRNGLQGWFERGSPA